MSVLRPGKARVCATCPLVDEPLVPGCGPSDAEIMLVGEAPARWEVVDQVPFVGHSGRYLNLLLEAAGLDRSACYITNALKCQIPPALAGKKTGPAITAAIAACQTRLAVEVRRVKPRVVVALGTLAFHALTGHKTGITAARGELQEPDVPFRKIPRTPKILPTFHPMYLIRGNEAYRETVIGDLRTARALATGTAIRARKPVKYHYCTTFGKALLLFRHLREQELIAFDIETTGYSAKQQQVLHNALDPRKAKIFMMSFAFAPFEAWVLPWYAHAKQDLWTLTQRAALIGHVQDLFTDPTKTWIIQNMFFEAKFLARPPWNIDLSQCRVFDLMMLQVLENENVSKGLDAIALMHTDMGNYTARLARKFREQKDLLQRHERQELWSKGGRG